MKIRYILSVLTIGCITFSSCNLDTSPNSDIITGDQKKEIAGTLPERLTADINGMFSSLGKQAYLFGFTATGAAQRDDDFGYPVLCLSQDLNGPDMVGDDSNYNWFSVSSEYSDRSDTYANPYMRYALPYYQIRLANDILESIPEDTDNTQLLVYKGQAKAVRAFDYLSLAPYFQFRYKGNEDKPCVPIVYENMTNAANNPRATVREVYEFIMNDLNEAITLLEGYNRTSKAEIDQRVAYGLRARANLYMENWADAAADADKALQGYTPYSREEVSKPTFISANDHNWMWGIIISPATVPLAYPTWPAKISSFSGDSYSAGAGCFKSINVLLYDKIPSTDVRKGWWVNDKLESDNLAGLTWGSAVGNEIPKLVIPNVKVEFLPYTNVKFGQYGYIGNSVNAGDWCLMRAEEMILIKAEATAMSPTGSVATGAQILEDFVKTYRNPSYSYTVTTKEAFQDEVWFQRRVELWGEGFSMSDIMRLGKNVVRFKSGVDSNFPESFKFNIAANDGWLLLRIAQRETNNNMGIPTSANNNEGSQPKSGDGAGLMDGVTD